VPIMFIAPIVFIAHIMFIAHMRRRLSILSTYNT
jgi:hypothetical protein